jgi:Tfp pilus assembly protein PilN
MIEINLLPGTGKKTRRSGVSSGLSTALSGFFGQIKDPYMIAAVASAIVCSLAVAYLHLGQMSQERSMRTAEEAALADSARYASVILEKRRAEARRDSVLRQVKLIEAIDNDRYVWPHLLAEVSKSVPQFTWIGELRFLNSAQSPAAAAPIDTAALNAATNAADSAAIASPRSNPDAPREPLRFALKGYTVDVQAMTRLIRDMESSPFIENVVLKGTKAAAQGVTVVTEFDLEGQYQQPDSMYVRRVAYTPVKR